VRHILGKDEDWAMEQAETTGAGVHEDSAKAVPS